MNPTDYYTSGQFARMAKVSLRTIRYYDKENILKPSYVKPSGARMYSEKDFTRLQQILLLKYLGFSLQDIRELTIDDTNYHMLLHSLSLQAKLVQDQIEQMQLVEQAIHNTAKTIEKKQTINWSDMLHLIHLTNMEKSMKDQYQNATNITSRIQLHHLYSQNTQGWFPWIFEQMNLKDTMNVLELGCGNGSLWSENISRLPEHLSIILSDISDGMVRDARRSLGATDSRFSFRTFDCHTIPYDDSQFDEIIANHLLFYCHDIGQVCQEIKRVIKPDGIFICSTYGQNHMKELTTLVQKFDERIVLSAHNLYESFGKENGEALLSPYFSNIKWVQYEDFLLVDSPDAIIEYILSCHGNQNQFLLNRYSEFRSFVTKEVSPRLQITKDAGIFICHN